MLYKKLAQIRDFLVSVFYLVFAFTHTHDVLQWNINEYTLCYVLFLRLHSPGKKKSLLLMSERDHTGKAYFILLPTTSKEYKNPWPMDKCRLHLSLKLWSTTRSLTYRSSIDYTFAMEKNREHRRLVAYFWMLVPFTMHDLGLQTQTRAP